MADGGEESSISQQIQTVRTLTGSRGYSLGESVAVSISDRIIQDS